MVYCPQFTLLITRPLQSRRTLHCNTRSAVQCNTAPQTYTIYYNELHCTTQHFARRRCATLHYTTLHCYNTILHCTCTTLYYTTLCLATLRYTSLYYTIRYTTRYTTLHYILTDCTKLKQTSLQSLLQYTTLP